MSLLTKELQECRNTSLWSIFQHCQSFVPHSRQGRQQTPEPVPLKASKVPFVKLALPKFRGPVK
jgi:hypothetical protein